MIFTKLFLRLHITTSTDTLFISNSFTSVLFLLPLVIVVFIILLFHHYLLYKTLYFSVNVNVTLALLAGSCEVTIVFAEARSPLVILTFEVVGRLPSVGIFNFFSHCFLFNVLFAAANFLHCFLWPFGLAAQCLI